MTKTMMAKIGASLLAIMLITACNNAEDTNTEETNTEETENKEEETSTEEESTEESAE
ncbi:hypothetical protein KUV80_11565 [Fictibacillus nanhaiensis]|uniref:hypothetical protein n=1 Tax=Fictibacillus nanhaiensis TaxID=742169 RepID=UPI001C96FF8C|nr:hypothetical protein [Fictibacillus nanhaiensis]MBY6037299.1 hypothetical protein [Fictibacillus nanhaiensis]